MKLKKLIKDIFPSLVELRNQIVNDAKHKRFRDKPMQEVFTTIYKENHWNDQASKSGPGSNYYQTQTVKRLLEEVISQWEIQSILDIPCGDFYWMKTVERPSVRYIGADIVKQLIDQNSSRYASDTHEFLTADITQTILPKTDLLFCRDCLVHLSYHEINRTKENILRTGSKYLLTTTFPNHTNRDIVTGNWRPINLQLAPFNFPEPIKVLYEDYTEDTRFADKALALWSIKSL